MRKSYVVVLFISAVALIPFILVSLCNQPTGDDFWCMWMVKKYGFFQAQVQWLSSMNGRYSANLLTSLVSVFFLRAGSVTLFKILPVVIIFAWIAVLYHLAANLLSKQLNFIQKLAIACFITAIYYINLPGIHDGIYWVSSIVCYQLPLILLVWLATFLIRTKQQLNKRQQLGLFLSVFIISGFHEMIGFMIAVLSLVMALLYKFEYKKRKNIFLLIFTSAGLSIAVRLVSIVNRYNDSAVNTERWSIIKCMVTAGKQTGYHIAARCLFSPSFYAGVFFVFFITYKYYRLPLHKTDSLKKHSRWWLAGLTCFMLLLPACLMICVENKLAGMRVINIAYFVFVCFVYINTAFAAIKMKRAANEKPIVWFSKYRAYLLLFFSITIILLPGNLYQLVLNISNGAAKNYNGEMTARFALLKTCNADTCQVSCLKNKPYILCPVDVCDDARLLGHLEKVYDKKLVIK